MSLFDSASLVVTPNGYKEDKLYSIKPTDGSGDLVVTRATTATRVNSAGLIEEVPYNLLQYSEQLGNAVWQSNLFGNWSVATVTSNTTTAPDGTMTADTISLTSPVSNSLQRVSVSPSNSYTYTIYIKAPNGQNYNNQLVLRVTTGNNNVLVNENFQVLNISSTISTTEWQRYTINFTVPSSGVNQVEVGVTSLNSLSINANVYAWGGQLVSGTSAKEYFPTTDRLNVPRLDYTNSSCPSILVEPQRTNLALRSEEFDNVSWVKVNTTITANAIISPDGTINADLCNYTAGSGSYINGGAIFAGNSDVVISVFVKANTISIFRIRESFYTGVSCVFDLSAQTAGTNGKIENYGNGWYRCSFKYNLSLGQTNINFIFDSNTATGSLYLWGAQAEVGSYATSYIPTVASTVTRNADVISKTGISSLIGQTEGVLFIESAALANDFTSRIISISDGTLNNRIIINYSASSNTIQLNVFSGGTAITLINYVVSDTTQFAKIAVRYSNTLGYSLWVNGVNRGSSVSTTIPASMSRLGFDNGSGGTFFVSKIKQVNLYKIALSNTEMATLTTL